MHDEGENSTDYETTYDVARLRLDCFVHAVSVLSASGNYYDFAAALAAARQLYSWLTDDEESADPGSITPAGQCERKSN